MLAQLKSATLLGLSVSLVEIEVDAAAGLPAWDIVGLPDTAVKESKERVRTAVRNAGYEFPPRRIVVNLAPAYLRKEGPSFDLAMAIAILVVTGQLACDHLDDFLLLGELGLDGSLRPVKGVLPISLEYAKSGYRLIVPVANQEESAIGGSVSYGFGHLREVAYFLEHPDSARPAEAVCPISARLQPAGTARFRPHPGTGRSPTGAGDRRRRQPQYSDGGFAGVRQDHAVPGAARYSAALHLCREPVAEQDLQHCRPSACPISPWCWSVPSRSPHHSASAASIIGGGRIPHPGEVSLSHHGVLFLDEFPEYRREVLEALRQPLEDGKVTVSRVQAQVTFPCRFLLVASMNPCPCGYLNDPTRQCTCTPGAAAALPQ